MGLHRFWDSDFISVRFFWFGAPVFAPWAPKVQKGQIFDFNTEPSKLMMKFLECILKPKAKFSVGPEFWFRAPKFFKKFSNSQKCSKFWNFSFFELGPFKFIILDIYRYLALDFISITKILFLVPRFFSKMSKIFNVFRFWLGL